MSPLLRSIYHTSVAILLSTGRGNLLRYALSLLRIKTLRNYCSITSRYHYQRESSSSIHLLAGSVAAVYLCSTNDEPTREYLLAAKNDDLKTLKKGIKNGIDINCTHLLGWSALHVAVINHNMEVIKWLIEEGGANIDVQDEYSSSKRKSRQLRTLPSHVAALRDREFSSSINHGHNYSGFTPLHYAIIVNDERIVKYLLENGADPTIEDGSGHTPINYCTNESIRKLLEEFADKIKVIKFNKKLEERKRYPLEDNLRQHLVGQVGAISTVASAIRRREMGWSDNDHPLVFLFLGSSGIGKTELAKQVANYLHKDNPKGFIRLDMSEYQERHEVAKLIGAPPGYIGYDEGGQLTKSLSQFPSAVVLLDEVDKAHPDVLTVLLQLFDEGRLTDGRGNTIECKDAIFVMTSNLASDEIAQHGMQLRKEAEMKSNDDESIEISQDFKLNIIEPILKRHFHRNEFLGRINEMVYFIPFSRNELHELVKLQLTLWQTRAKERHSINLTWDKEVLDILADGYNIKYGARSIHHEVERKVVNQLALAYEQQTIKQGTNVHLVIKIEENSGSPLIKLNVTNDHQNKATCF